MMGVGEFWGQLLGLLEVMDRLADLTAHRMCRCEVDHVARLPFRREGLVVHVVGEVQGRLRWQTMRTWSATGSPTTASAWACLRWSSPG
jgi:hypothetical protein